MQLIQTEVGGERKFEVVVSDTSVYRTIETFRQIVTGWAGSGYAVRAMIGIERAIREGHGQFEILNAPGYIDRYYLAQSKAATDDQHDDPFQ